MKNVTKGQLVDMDNRFLEWLNVDDYNIGFESGNYLTVSTTPEGAVDFRFFKDKNELKAAIKSIYSDTDESEWEIKALFDLINKKEIKFTVKVEVIFK